MKRSEADKVYALLEQWTRAEIMARFGESAGLGFGDYAMIKIDKEDEIRKLVFGESNLYELGEKWGLLKEKKTDRKRGKKKGKIR